MKVSARNAFKGTIAAIHPGAVNAEVTVNIAGGDTIVAVVTEGSIQSLGLAIGKEVVALIKAPWVMIATGDCGLKFSARNQLAGKVTALIKGGVNTEVAITLPGGTTVFSVITNEAVAELGLIVDKPASAVIKSSHVILAVTA
jgi:molybdate transport system regulatory protein